MDLPSLDRDVNEARLALSTLSPDDRVYATTLRDTGKLLEARYRETEDVVDLQTAIDTTKTAVEAMSEDHPDRAATLNDIATWLRARFRTTRELDDIDHTVKYARLAVAATSHDDPSRITYLKTLSLGLNVRYQERGMPGDQDEAIEVAEGLVSNTPLEHPGDAAMLNDLGMWRKQRFQRTGSIGDLRRAVALGKSAVEAASATGSDSTRITPLGNLVRWLALLYENTAALEDLSQLIWAAEEHVDCNLSDAVKRVTPLSNLVLWLHHRFTMAGDIQDLDQAIRFGRLAVGDSSTNNHLENNSSQVIKFETVNAESTHDRELLSCMHYLVNVYFKRFFAREAAEDLNQGIALAKLVLQTLPPGHHDRHAYLLTLMDMLEVRFAKSRDVRDVDERIETMYKVLDAIPRPHDHPDGIRISIALGKLLNYRSTKRGDPEDIERAIAVYIKMTDSLPRTHSSLAPSLITMSGWLVIKSDYRKDQKYLDEAIEMSNLAVGATSGHDERMENLNQLGQRLHQTFERTGSMISLEQGIAAANEALNGTPPAHPSRPVYLNSVAIYLTARHERTGSVDDLQNAIANASQAIEELPADDIRLFVPQITLANLLRLEYQRAGQIECVDRGIELLDAVVSATAISRGQLAKALNTQGNMLGLRFTRTGQTEDLLRSIEILRVALEIHQGSDSERAIILNSLATKIGYLCDQTEKVQDLHEAVRFSGMSVEATADGNITKAPKLNSLAVLLMRRFRRIGDIDDINKAVATMEHALKLTQADHVDRSLCLNTLGEALVERFERTGEHEEDLDRAIDIAKEVVEALASDHPDWPLMLQNLAQRLDQRFQYSGDIRDLHQAIDTSIKALEVLPTEHRTRLMAMARLSGGLKNRFHRLGDIEDLNRAIDLIQQSVDMVSSDHVDKASYLEHLSELLRARWEHTGALEHINRAIQISRMALDATPVDHPSHPHRLAALGLTLGNQFERTKEIEVLNESIHAITQAELAATGSSVQRAMYQISLGGRLQQRYGFLKNEADLDHAIQLFESAIEIIPVGHENRITALNSLVQLLHQRSERTGGGEDLGRASKVALMNTEETPQGHPDRAICLFTLGSTLLSQYWKTGDPDAVDRSVESFKEAWGCDNARPSVRMKCARWLGVLYAEGALWIEAATFFRKALDLLPMISPLSLPNSDKQSILAEFGGLSSMAAVAALNAGGSALEALELLELGRGVIASLVLDMRADLSDLSATHPNLAAQFISHRDVLDMPEAASVPGASSESSSWELRAKERRQREQQFHDTCNLIRSQPGFETFLLPPTTEQMLDAARLGSIVVVNVSPWRSDALILTVEGATAIHFPMLDFKQAQDISRKLQSPHLHGNQVLIWILEWAWDVVAQPCLEALGLHGPPPLDSDHIPHIWWILTGPLSHLPIHAAGRHARGSHNTVLDRAMSSYSSSIKALLHSRHKAQVHEQSTPTALLVDMGTTADQRALPFAREEIAMLEQICNQIKIEPVHPAQKRKEDVLAILKSCTVFHFAGHGKSNGSDPSRSCLLLDDWQSNPLSVADLRDNWADGQAPFLAYLSACSTGSSRHDSLADEAIHLVSACQLAGFRHVVGTLWAVSDRHCVDVARTFYGVLQKAGMTDLAVCKGLHYAVHRLRDVDVHAQEIRAAKNTRRHPLGGDNPFLNHGANARATESNNGRDAKEPVASYRGLLKLDEDWWYTQGFLSQQSLSVDPGPEQLTQGPDAMVEVLDHERDATICDSDDEDVPALGPLLWAPYFHFGV
ncbi:CHAT domain-containing protein [Aspergillus cavernicola]|uniref:CHAT domain-containing protein n=1 Tax=Aspergillus cavernicola TaxID=176166 RepID=A0ABR4IIB6_9EURO